MRRGPQIRKPALMTTPWPSCLSGLGYLFASQQLQWGSNGQHHSSSCLRSSPVPASTSGSASSVEVDLSVALLASVLASGVASSEEADPVASAVASDDASEVVLLLPSSTAIAIKPSGSFFLTPSLMRIA